MNSKIVFFTLFKIQDPENHTLFRGTYLFRADKGVPPPAPHPRTKTLMTGATICALSSRKNRSKAANVLSIHKGHMSCQVTSLIRQKKIDVGRLRQGRITPL